MTSIIWEKELDKIKHGEKPLEINADGMPAIATGAPHYELIQLMKALAEGYNRSFSKVAAFRKACRNAVNNWRDE